jgi:hypothetical protein
MVWSVAAYENWLESIINYGTNIGEIMAHLRDIMQAAVRGEIDDWGEFLKVCVIFASVPFSMF